MNPNLASLFLSLALSLSVSANTVVNVSNFSFKDGTALPIFGSATRFDEDGGGVPPGEGIDGCWAVGRYLGDLNLDITLEEALENFDQNGSAGTFLPGHPGFIQSSVTDAKTSVICSLPDRFCPLPDRFTDPAEGGPWPIVMVIGDQSTLESSNILMLIDTGKHWKPEFPIFGGVENISLADVRRIVPATESGTDHRNFFGQFHKGEEEFAIFNGGMGLDFHPVPRVNNGGVSLTSFASLHTDSGKGAVRIRFEDLGGQAIPGASWEIVGESTRRSSGDLLLGRDPGPYNLDLFLPSNLDYIFLDDPDSIYLAADSLVEYTVIVPTRIPAIHRITSIVRGSGSVTLTWESISGHLDYAIDFSHTLQGGWSEIASFDAGEGSVTPYEVTSYVDTHPERISLGSGFYRIRWDN